jgi:hypothetical protein
MKITLIRLFNSLTSISFIFNLLFLSSFSTNAAGQQVENSLDSDIFYYEVNLDNKLKFEDFKVSKYNDLLSPETIVKIELQDENISLPIEYQYSNGDAKNLKDFIKKYITQLQKLKSQNKLINFDSTLKGSTIEEVRNNINKINNDLFLGKLNFESILNKVESDDYLISGLKYSSKENNREKLNNKGLLNNQNFKHKAYVYNNIISYDISNVAINNLKTIQSNNYKTAGSEESFIESKIIEDVKLKDILYESKQQVMLDEDNNIYKEIFFGENVNSKTIENESNKKISDEVKASVEHSNKVKQFYTQEEQELIDIVENKNNLLSKIFGGIKADAKGLNNSASELLIYSWSNTNLALDLPGGNLSNGNQFQVYARNGTNAQRFTFNNQTNEVKIQGKCLDINNSNFNNGTKVQVWDCNGSNSQKWVFDGTQLKAKANDWKCLDASGSMNQGSQVQIWDCHGGSNQRWVAGSNDFTTQRQIWIYATPTGNISGGDYGHVLVSFDNAINGVTNTMTSWSDAHDYNSNNTGRYNNNADGDAAYVDVEYDWNKASYARPSNWRHKYHNISKKLSDVYRYNSGYRYGYTIPSLTNAWATFNYTYVPNPTTFNCSKLSTRIWDDVLDDSGIYNPVTREEWWPTNVYNKL